jgi:uncharacterized membrane protein
MQLSRIYITASAINNTLQNIFLVRVKKLPHFAQNVTAFYTEWLTKK